VSNAILNAALRRLGYAKDEDQRVWFPGDGLHAA
jgi:hypothetical protein